MRPLVHYLSCSCFSDNLELGKAKGHIVRRLMVTCAADLTPGDLPGHDDTLLSNAMKLTIQTVCSEIIAEYKQMRV